MIIPVKSPNKFIFNGFYYNNIDLVQIALIENHNPKHKVIGLFMIPRQQTPNVFGQMCPKIFITGELDKHYVKVSAVSSDIALPEKFLSDYDYPLSEIPEEIILEMLNINTIKTENGNDAE
jgi:hypothetical protein